MIGVAVAAHWLTIASQSAADVEYHISHSLNHTHTLTVSLPRCQKSVKPPPISPLHQAPPPSSAASLLSPRLVTCVSHSWPTCCSSRSHTHINGLASIVHTCLSDAVRQRWGEWERRRRSGERGGEVTPPLFLNIFNLRVKLWSLSPGGSLPSV